MFVASNSQPAGFVPSVGCAKSVLIVLMDENALDAIDVTVDGMPSVSMSQLPNALLSIAVTV